MAGRDYDWKKLWWRLTLKSYPALADEIFDGPIPRYLTDQDVADIEQFVNNFDLGDVDFDDNVQSVSRIMTETLPGARRKETGNG